MDEINTRRVQPEVCLRARALENERDWQRARQMLIETHSIAPPEFNWDIRRWDGWRYHNQAPVSMETYKQKFRLWETAQGALAGIAHPEGDGDLHLQVHPDYRLAVEEEMLSWAEQNLPSARRAGQPRQLTLSIYDYDVYRLRLAQAHGFQRLEETFVSRRLRLGVHPLPAPDLCQDYTLRTTRAGDEGDCQRMADLLNASFQRTIHSAEEHHTFVTQSPSFRHDLNLVAVAADGAFAAHVGLTVDEVNRYAVFEPVCTHPAHVRRGLARSLMLEGLHRLRELGVHTVSVGTGDMLPANSLYDAMGFTEAYRGSLWQKTFED